MNPVVQHGPFAGFEIIHTYTRYQAIADGVLVDLSSSFPNETRMFRWNVCCTDTIWNLIERAAEADECEVAVYVWDVCYMACTTIQHVKDADQPELFFKVCLPLRESGTERRLKLVCGPTSFDDPSPCLTIMLTEED